MRNGDTLDKTNIDLSSVVPIQRLLDRLANKLDLAVVQLWSADLDEEVFQQRAVAAAAGFLSDDNGDRTVNIQDGRKIKFGGKPQILKDLSEAEQFANEDWIKAELIVDFAGYPLFVGDRLVGLLCAYSRRPISDEDTEALASAAKSASSKVERLLIDEERRTLTYRLETAREDERRRIARHLHDDISQQLSVISINLFKLEQKLVDTLPPDSTALSDIVLVQEMLTRNQRALRNIAYILHPGILEAFGLAKALRRFCDDVALMAPNSSSKMACDLDSEFPRLADDIETAVYRIAQEAVMNAVKHAHAATINLRLTKTGDQGVVTIEDDGLGFDTNLDKLGVGLAGIRERADLLGSSLQIDSKAGQGTSITLKFDLILSNQL